VVALGRLRAARRRLAPLQLAAGALFALYLVVGVTLVMPRLSEDGVAYYAETRSVILDGDLDLADEYRRDPGEYAPGTRAGPRAVLPRDLDGRFEQDVNLGVVVLLAPFFLLAHVLAFLANLVGVPVVMDGYDRVYILAAAFGTGAMVLAGAFLLVAYLRPRVGLAAGLVGVGAIWLGSQLFLRTTFRPIHTHALAVVLEALFVVLFLTRGRRITDVAAWLVLGVIAGLLLTLRPLSGLYGLVPAAWLVVAGLWPAWRTWVEGTAPVPERARAALRAILPSLIAGLAFLAGTFVGRLPQFVLARDFSLIGSAFYSETGYLGGAIEGDLLAGLASLLFDPRQGLFVWVPIVPLSLLGLLAFWRRDRLTMLACLAWAALIWGFTAMLGVPERFGSLTLPSRHLIEATPVYIIGVAGLVAGSRDVTRWLAARRAHVGADAARLRDRWIRWIPRVAILAIALVALYGFLAQVSDTVVEGELPVLERLRQLAAEPILFGRLYPEPRGLSPERYMVFLGSYLLRGLIRLDGRLLLEFVSGFALLALIGGLCLSAAAAAWRLVAGRGVVVPDAARRTAAVAGDASQVPPAGRAHAGWGRWRARLRPATGAVIAAWLIIVALIGPLLAERLIAPRIEVDGSNYAATELPLDFGQPEGSVLTAVTYGHPREGNEVIVPPAPARGELPADRSTMTRGTFGPVGPGRQAVFTPTEPWDVVTGYLLWFGPTFDPTAAAEVRVGWADEEDAQSIRTLTASDLALGTVTIELPLRLPAEQRQLRLEVRPLLGRPAPEVSIHRDGSLAFLPMGVADASLPVLQTAGGTLMDIPSGSRLPEGSFIRLERSAAATLRLGPWSAAGLLRAADDHPGWHLPETGLAEGTWSDWIEPSTEEATMTVRVEAPAPITEATANLLYTPRGTSRRSGQLIIEASADGAEYQTLAVVPPVTLRRLASATTIYRPAEPVASVSFRVRVIRGEAGIVLNGAWFDASLEVPGLAQRMESAGGVTRSAMAPAEDETSVRVEFGRRPGQIRGLVYALADLSRASLQAVGAVGLMLASLLLLAAALALARSRQSLLVPGVLGLAAVSATLAVLLLPRVSGGA
jgi:hypothetical protein